MRTLQNRLIAALALALLLLSSTAFGRVATFCNMAGRTVSSCCCHHAEAAEGAKSSASEHAAPAARRAACCEQRTAKASVVPANLNDFTHSTALAAAVTLIPESSVEWSVKTLEAVPRAARGPPRYGPPLYIEHCALLN